MSFDRSGASKQYLRMKVESASPVGLVVILYDGGIKFIRKALDELEHKRYMGFSDNLVKAQNIVRELRDSLDMNITEIAPQLRSLYVYMLKRLIESSIAKKPEPAQEVLNMMESLREAWDKVKTMSESGQLEPLQKNRANLVQKAPMNTFTQSMPSSSGLNIKG
ncbi:MAG: flagellar export chaperone FliS [Candidatus Auribacterota bacterium]|jgi:flagellar protein FliS|uniref:Flagellar export chaperone FliS n=1 Tax=Candidatus Auribacter fodinae TaxID=2093366 RepID=A0A3A4RGD7_9BACT|nr:MAG: flagellar export chaperone FliS [Candidatus Auribacter fodinae]